MWRRRRELAEVEGAKDWFKARAPRNNYQYCYRRKSDALKAFEGFNTHVTEPWPIDDYDCASFDAINVHYGLHGNRRVCTLAHAMWVALPPKRPYCLTHIDIQTLNETTPGQRFGFHLPDHVLEQQLDEEQGRYWRSRAASADLKSRTSASR